MLGIGVVLAVDQAFWYAIEARQTHVSPTRFKRVGLAVLRGLGEKKE